MSWVRESGCYEDVFFNLSFYHRIVFVDSDYKILFEYAADKGYRYDETFPSVKAYRKRKKEILKVLKGDLK